MLSDAIAKVRQEELRREAEQERLARLVRACTREEHARPGRFVAAATRLAAAGRAAARLLQLRPSGPEERSARSAQRGP